MADFPRVSAFVKKSKSAGREIKRDAMCAEASVYKLRLEGGDDGLDGIRHLDGIHSRLALDGENDRAAFRRA